MVGLHCRATLLLQKEYFKLEREKIWGIKVTYKENEKPLEWNVQLSGLQNTPWKDSMFTLVMKFTEEFNDEPPTVFFERTIPMHPNVDPYTGQVCLGRLEEWEPDTPLYDVLLSMQQLLSEPCNSKAWNKEAVHLMKNSSLCYGHVILKGRPSPNASSRTSPRSVDTSFNTSPQVTYLCQKSNVVQLSYDNYLELWKSMGTTKTHTEDSRVINDSPRNEYWQDGNETVEDSSVDEEFNRKLSDYRKLIYGNFDSHLKDTHIEQKHHDSLKAFYMNGKGIHVCLPQSSANLTNGLNKRKEKQQSEAIYSDRVTSDRVTSDRVTSDRVTSDRVSHSSPDSDELDGMEARDLLAWTEALPN